MESRLSMVGLGGCNKERFKGNGNFLGWCKEGIDLDGGGACVALLASGDFAMP